MPCTYAVSADQTLLMVDVIRRFIREWIAKYGPAGSYATEGKTMGKTLDAIVLAAVIAASAGFSAACGASSTSPPASAPPAAGSTPAVTQSAAAGGSSTDTNQADIAACHDVSQAAPALISDNGDPSSSVDLVTVGSALQGPTDGGTDADPVGNSDMSLSLATAFVALGDDTTGGGTTSMTTASVSADAQAVVSGCVAAGVLIPSGFTSAVAAAAMANSAA